MQICQFRCLSEGSTVIKMFSISKMSEIAPRGGGGGTVGQNQGARYLNWINQCKWTNLGAKYVINCYPRPPWQTKKNLILSQLMRKKIDFEPCLYFFMDFQYKTLKDFFCLQIALTRSIFELEKCSFFSNRSEFRQKLIGNVISELRRQKCI